MNSFNGVLLMSETEVNSFVKQMLESRSESVQDGVAAADQSIGSILAAARMEKEWTVQQVADQLKLSTKQIVALEGNNFDDLPKLVIVRGFVRTYAKLLKIDADSLVALLPKDAQNIQLQETLKPALSTPFMESRLSLMGRQDSNKKYLFGAALLALFAAGFFIVQKSNIIVSMENFFRGQSVITPDVKMGSDVVIPPTTEIAPANIDSALLSPDTPPVAVNVLPESEKKIAQSAQVVQQINPGTVLINEIKSSSGTVPISSPQLTPPVIADKDMMKLKFRQDSWIQVRKENGVIVTSHLAKAGTEEVFSVKELLQVRIGNAAGVEGVLRGAPLEILAEKGSNVVNLNVK
jgi:cytoskeleton protein RodZ